MERKLRHHIIEGLVIIALIAIFGPSLFTHANKNNTIEPVEPPAFPDKANYDRSLTPLKVEASPLAAQPAPLYIAKPEAWVVQLGSFTEKQNANVLLSKLRADKMRVFTYNKELPTGSVTRVYVGPVTTKENADNLLAELESDLNLKGIVIHFNPLEL